MVRFKDNDSVFIIEHWLRLRNTIECMGAYKTLHDLHFKPTEFGRFVSESNAFTMLPNKWIEVTNQTKTLNKNSVENRFRKQFPENDVGNLLGN